MEKTKEVFLDPSFRGALKFLLATAIPYIIMGIFYAGWIYKDAQKLNLKHPLLLALPAVFLNFTWYLGYIGSYHKEYQDPSTIIVSRGVTDVIRSSKIIIGILIAILLYGLLSRWNTLKNDWPSLFSYFLFLVIYISFLFPRLSQVLNTPGEKIWIPLKVLAATIIILFLAILVIFTIINAINPNFLWEPSSKLYIGGVK